MGEFIGFIFIAFIVISIWLKIKGSSTSTKPSRNHSSKNKKPSQSEQSTQNFHWPHIGDFDFDAVGESFYQRDLETIAGPHGTESVEINCVATLKLEDDNPHDPKAVAVIINGCKVGHLSREDARSFRRRLGQKRLSGATTTCDAIIVGGGTRRNGEKLMYGVKLDIKPFDY